MISLISRLSLKLYLNSLVYHRNIVGSSFRVLGNLRELSENVQERSSGLRNEFGKSSESGRKSSENHQKRLHQHVCMIKKKYTLARRYEFYVLVARTIYLSRSQILFLPLEHKIHIFESPCNILWQEIIKVREWIHHIGPLAKVIRLKLFLDIVLSSSADITRALRGCFRGGSVHISFRFVLSNDPHKR